MTWTCHICKEERPDAKISVCSTVSTKNGIEVKQNVRYCNDRPECAEAAKRHSFFA